LHVVIQAQQELRSIARLQQVKALQQDAETTFV